VEDVYDQGIGDLFVARVAGNFINVDILGSIEYACKVSGAHLIVVMGHQNCGAIKSTIDNVELGNITEMLAKIRPAVAMSQDFAGDKKSKNDDYVRYVSENNVRHAMQEIRDKSPILKEMEAKGQVRIVGAFYRLTDGLLEYVQ
jgi:carbonic anhydrase